MNRQLKLGAILSYSSLLFSLIIGVIYTPFMLSRMGSSEYGLYSLALSIVTYLNILENGFSAGVVRYVAYYNQKNEKEKLNKVVCSSILIYVCLGLLCLLLGVFLYNQVDNFYGVALTLGELRRLKIIVLVLVVYISINFPANVFVSIIIAYENFIFLKAANLIKTIILPLVMTPLLLLGYRAVAMAVVTITVGLVLSIVYICFCLKNYDIDYKTSNIDKSTLKNMLSFAAPMLTIIACDCLCRSFGNFYVGVYGGTIAVTILALAIQLRGYFESFIKSVSSFFLPYFSKKIASQADKISISNDFIKVSRIEFHIAFILISGFLWFGIRFLQFWTAGIEVLEVYRCSLIIIIPLIFSMAESVGEEIIKAYNVQKKQMYIYLLRAIIVLIITLAFSSKYEYYACACAIGISVVICDIILMNYLYHKVLHLDVITLFKSLFPSLVYVFIGCLINNLFCQYSLIIQLMLFVIYIIGYSFICFSKSEKNLIMNKLNISI